MRTKVALGAQAAAAALALIVLAPSASASTGLSHWKVNVRTHLARPGWAAHWYGRGRYGNFGRVVRHSSPLLRNLLTPLVAPDLLQNPGNNEIMPTRNTHLIFWLPSGFHFIRGVAVRIGVVSATTG